MPTYCAGVTAKWATLPLGEVVDIKLTLGGALPIGRTAAFAIDKGSIEIACLSTANISPAKYGKKAVLELAGGGMDFTHKAIYKTFTLTGKLNDVTRASVTFQLVGE